MDSDTMPISIRDPETDRLARQVAKLTGETITDAIGTALRERLAREQARGAGRVARLLAIGDRCANICRGRSARPTMASCSMTSRFAAMIVDSSALLAILFAEPDGAMRWPSMRRPRCACRPSISWKPPSGSTWAAVDRQEPSTTDPGSPRHHRAGDRRAGDLARRAYRTYGRGSGSPARLNLGDCFAYALAKATGEPLLFKGDDFGHTDAGLF